MPPVYVEATAKACKAGFFALFCVPVFPTENARARSRMWRRIFLGPSFEEKPVPFLRSRRFSSSAASTAAPTSSHPNSCERIRSSSAAFGRARKRNELGSKDLDLGHTPRERANDEAHGVTLNTRPAALVPPPATPYRLPTASKTKPEVGKPPWKLYSADSLNSPPEGPGVSAKTTPEF